VGAEKCRTWYTLWLGRIQLLGCSSGSKGGKEIGENGGERDIICNDGQC
jgi:hypothetical protein